MSQFAGCPQLSLAAPVQVMTSPGCIEVKFQSVLPPESTDLSAVGLGAVVRRDAGYRVLRFM